MKSDFEKNDFTYSEAIEQIMLQNDYVAPLKLIYKEIWKYKDKSKIKGKTPYMTIQERVQRDKKFTRIGLGVYALTEKLDLLQKQKIPSNEKEKIISRHGEIQGMLLEIGNNKNDVEETYTNDKKFVFQNKRLGSIATIQSVPFFTYEHIIKESVAFADVIWFNERMFPSKVFEVENSTDFRDAFVKFMELQDFMTDFVCVSPSERKVKFDRERQKTAFRPIAERVKFYSYEDVENDYNLSLQKFRIV